MAYGTINADQIGTSVVGSSLGAGNATLMKNKIINGACVIDQRNAGASVTPTANTVVYTVDRFYGYQSQSSKFSVQQNAGSVTPPVGFTNYLGVTSLSAYSITSTDQFLVGQRIEGFNAADLGWGTANAKAVTLSFQVYSSLTGTFGGAINNSAFNRSYPFSYSIPVANTWTTISVTIAGDTTGTWTTTNGIFASVVFNLGSGATYSTTANAWAAGNYTAPTGATSVVGTNGATFYITGVQLEVGTSATGFEYRQYQQELALCQRYYWTGNVRTGGTNSNSVGSLSESFISFQATMRTTPTLSKTADTQTNCASAAVVDTAALNGFRYYVQSNTTNPVNYGSSAVAYAVAEL